MKTIPLTRGLVAIVDDDDYESLSRLKWCACGRAQNEYAVRAITCKGVKNLSRIQFMHRAIMNPPLDMQVDHINGNKLDNRRTNLRLCTPAENSRNQARPKNNTSGFKGVSWNRREQKWKAVIGVGGKRIGGGSYHTKEEAARAYDELARKHHGEFARLDYRETP